MKRMLTFMFSALVMVALVACGGSSGVDDATAEKYISKAEEVVSLLNEGKYAEVHALFDEDMEAGLPVEDMEELGPIIEQSGDFEKIDQSAVEEEDGYYVVVLIGEYSNENLVYTVTFNEEDEVAGLYIN